MKIPSLVLAMPIASRTAGPTAPSPVSELSAASAPLRLGIVGLSHDHVHWLLSLTGERRLFDVVRATKAIAAFSNASTKRPASSSGNSSCPSSPLER